MGLGFPYVPILFRQDRMNMMKNHETPGTVMTNCSRIMPDHADADGDVDGCPPVMRQWNIPYGSFDGNSTLW